ncbi:MAG: fasciclin domain-containing protein [Litorivicinus sp.]
MYKKILAALLAGSVSLSAMAGSMKSDIVETAAEAGTFKTLLAAAEAAGLVGTLKGDGPLTIFAPTDEAFAKLPAGTVENLLKAENKDQLTAVLTYHVVPGKVMAGDVVGLDQATSVQGDTIDISINGDSVMVDAANVIATDIQASNGVIHVIDSVILPN